MTHPIGPMALATVLLLGSPLHAQFESLGQDALKEAKKRAQQLEEAATSRAASAQQRAPEAARVELDPEARAAWKRTLGQEERTHRRRLARIRRLRQLAEEAQQLERLAALDALEARELSRHERRREDLRKTAGDEPFQAADAQLARGRQRTVGVDGARRAAGARPPSPGRDVDQPDGDRP